MNKYHILLIISIFLSATAHVTNTMDSEKRTTIDMYLPKDRRLMKTSNNENTTLEELKQKTRIRSYELYEFFSSYSAFLKNPKAFLPETTKLNEITNDETLELSLCKVRDNPLSPIAQLLNHVTIHSCPSLYIVPTTQSPEDTISK